MTVFIALWSQFSPNALQVFALPSQDCQSSTYVCKNWMFWELCCNCTTLSSSVLVYCPKPPKWDRCNSTFCGILHSTLILHFKLSYVILINAQFSTCLRFSSYIKNYSIRIIVTLFCLQWQNGKMKITNP